MAKRDPVQTKRNKEIKSLSQKIKEYLPEVLDLTGYETEQSLNGTYGGKYAEYIDIKNEVIDTPQQFRSLYYQGFRRRLDSLNTYAASKNNPYIKAFVDYRDNKIVREWLNIFLERTYLRNYNALSKKRPTPEESVIWIGQENASYGILVTPCMRHDQWTNDQSEIRHFKPNYWTIGHVLETGLVIPSENEKIEFSDYKGYLSFFKNTLVRNSGSVHEKEIAKLYCEFVENAKDPLDIPLLIPELRYGGIDKKHKYRLDFSIINPFNMSKVGFELSPWSTHGALTGTKNKKQKDINSEALANFEKETRKQKEYFRKFRITVLIYTDSDLKNYENIFEDMKNYLGSEQSSKQLEFQAVEDLLSFSS